MPIKEKEDSSSSGSERPEPAMAVQNTAFNLGKYLGSPDAVVNPNEEKSAEELLATLSLEGSTQEMNQSDQEKDPRPRPLHDQPQS